MNSAFKNYLVVTFGYWAFTITDGAIRMLVVLYFHLQGYSPLQVATLFLFYEFFGIITNLIGGWLGARIGLNLTMNLGMVLQIIALLSLTVPEHYLTISFVMVAQALSGIAKDLNKMSAKASVKSLTNANHSLFKWVAVLTGSKNALKGLGFFVGAALLDWVGFRYSLAVLAGLLFIVLLMTLILLPSAIGKMTNKPKFSHVFSHIKAINILSAARFFLFASRDVWFVVALPVFLYETLNWSFSQVGSFLALWVIGYGLVQAFSPKLLSLGNKTSPNGNSALFWAMLLAIFPAGIALALHQGWAANLVIIVGLVLFGIIFAINSAIHSYLILAYSDKDKVAMSVGFYYMANAGGRLMGTLLSGWIYQAQGLVACLWVSSLLISFTVIISLILPKKCEF